MSSATIICECMSLDCTSQITLTKKEYLHWRGMPGTHVFIARGCKHGPESTDKLVADKGNYKVYREE